MEEFLPESDDHFAYTIDYTSGGLPYGIGREEWNDMERTTEMHEKSPEAALKFREWTKDIDEWPGTWMGIEEDLEYGRCLLPHLKEFLQDLVEGGMARRTFVRYRDDAWLLGGSIISNVSLYEEYDVPPLDKLRESVECDGILPDHYDRMSEEELINFERMCRRFEKFLNRTGIASQPVDDDPLF